MPFDGKDVPNLVALEKLETVRALLGDRQQWCKDSLINAFGQMCILGALRRVDAEGALRAPILAAVREVTGKTFRSVERFNDHPRTTHATVLQVLDRTREGLSSGGYAAGDQDGPWGRWRSACRYYITAALMKV